MYSISPTMTGQAVRRSPLPEAPVQLQGPGVEGPFCEGRFLEDLPRFRPTVARSWCEMFSQCLGLAEPVGSATATAHRQLLDLLDRLPDTVPGNTDLQAHIDRLKIGVGSCAMGRYLSGDEPAVLQKLIELSVAARRIEHQLEEDYRKRWQPAHSARRRPFPQLAEPRAFQGLL